MTRTQAVGVGMKLREHRVEFAQSDHRRTIGNVGAVVAGRLKLAGSLNSFQERRQFVSIDGGASGGVLADYGRMGNRNSLLLETASGVLNSAADAGIFLTEHPHG